MSKQALIKTYGCQMNEYDSLRIQDLLASLGYIMTLDMEQADLLILNTCHTREQATKKVYSELFRIDQIRHRREQNGQKTIVVVAGCTGQAEGDAIFKHAQGVDIVVGPQSYHALPKLLNRIEQGEKHLLELDFIETAKFDQLPEEITTIQGVSGLVSIQEGCDKFCSFCVVSYTRGAEFSRPVEQVYREVLQLVQQGAKEIVLLGQNVNAYHGIGDEGKAWDLATLIKRITTIPELQRIRYTTAHPNDMTESLILAHRDELKLMPFLHLSIQSGSNRVLKEMNRKYTRESYLEILYKLKETCPQITVSSDFIVGFAGETEEDFLDTLSLVQEVGAKIGLSQAFAFKYSPRPGTPGATKPQVPEAVKMSRLAALQKALLTQQLAFNNSCIGKTLEVLFDKDGKHEGQLLGKTPYMQSVYITNPTKSLYGQIMPVLITEAFPSSLTGQVVSH